MYFKLLIFQSTCRNTSEFLSDLISVRLGLRGPGSSSHLVTFLNPSDENFLNLLNDRVSSSLYITQREEGKIKINLISFYTVTNYFSCMNFSFSLTVLLYKGLNSFPLFIKTSLDGSFV